MPKWAIFLISSKVSNSQSKEFVLITEISWRILVIRNWENWLIDDVSKIVSKIKAWYAIDFERICASQVCVRGFFSKFSYTCQISVSFKATSCSCYHTCLQWVTDSSSPLLLLPVYARESWRERTKNQIQKFQMWPANSPNLWVTV